MQKMLSHLRRCVDEYRMIQAGDRIAVGVSGGKDSLVLLRTLAELRRFYPVPFEVVAITLDMGYDGADFSPIAKLCEEIGVEYIVKPTNIKEVVFDIRNEKNPCALCAKLRRGSLNDAAKEYGCNKVALGHHFDDAVETFMLSLFYEGRLSCFLPVTYLDRTDLYVIRPMLYMTEREVINFANRQQLPICKSGCPVDKETKREDIKNLIRSLEHDYHDLRQHIFGAMQRLPLNGWEPIDPRGRKKKGE
ncbi:MAG: tRNA 2-thiocytidine biosynthesis protein TtcA [Clostridia bacterium]|nr:tRNA 2-thiocytidine biosynthesis protein TtcA [Clostridia bacterium]MBQ3091148.1 tRNA 2-thiocytidine biosynthesis protein TtcA [Clostridia bacterium]